MAKQKTHAEFVKEVYNLVGDEYEVIGIYIRSSDKIDLLHKKCNNIYSVTPNHFLKGNRCPCDRNERVSKSKTKTTEQFRKEIYDLVGNEYELLTEYIDNKTPVKIKHNKCGHIYSVKPVLFTVGKRCPRCFGTPKKTTEQFRKEVYDLTHGEYELLSEYDGCHKYVNMKHNKCGKIYKVEPNKFLYGRRCPYCRRSVGEERICNYLEKLNISYKQYEEFEDLYYKSKDHPLTFDVSILCEDPNQYILIEYDGEYHERNPYYKESLESQKIRDKLKDDYCASHDNIDFYRINYRDFNNIEKIIDEILSNYQIE